MYGRYDLARIATELEGKTEEEVRRYAEVFWQRLEEISDWQKLLKRIEDGEAVIQRRRELEQVRQQKDADMYLTTSLASVASLYFCSTGLVSRHSSLLRLGFCPTVLLVPFLTLC